MTLIAKIRNQRIKPKVKKLKSIYKNTEKEKINDYQIVQFNKLWQDIQKNISYYNELVEKEIVPKKISTYDDFLQIPILDRVEARKNIEYYSDRTKSADSWVTTGGSTGTPLKYPVWKNQDKVREGSSWYLRDFYNIDKSDRMYRIWGHSHTLGTGLKRIITKVKFMIGLPLVGYKRFSAYDLSRKRLRQAGDEIIKFKPKYIIGYSKALTLLAKANEDKRDKFHQLNLKAIIGAAEGFDKEEDIDLVENIFGCPVGMEYGSMESNLIAHTHPNGGFKTIWRDYLIECVDENGNPSESGRILLTSLYKRAFPLVRYELGDIILNTKKSDIAVYEFDKIQGRDNDFLMLDDETPIHSEGITHAIKFSDKISAYQIRYTEDNMYTIYIRSNEKINENDINEIRKRLDQVDSRLSKLAIKQVDELKQTIAGKTNWLMKE